MVKPITIAEVHCPSNCSSSEKGAFFKEDAQYFSCTRCKLKIWRKFMGYQLTPLDLSEMFQFKFTSRECTLISRQDAQDKSFKSALMLDENFKVKLVSKIRNKEQTEELCPSCGAILTLNTNQNGTRWYGCSNYPACKFTKKTDPVVQPTMSENQPILDPFRGAKPMEPAQSMLSPDEIPEIKEEPESPALIIPEKDYIPPETESDKFKNIPMFVKQMLHLELN